MSNNTTRYYEVSGTSIFLPLRNCRGTNYNIAKDDWNKNKKINTLLFIGLFKTILIYYKITTNY